jgi:hypothetical protein
MRTSCLGMTFTRDKYTRSRLGIFCGAVSLAPGTIASTDLRFGFMVFFAFWPTFASGVPFHPVRYVLRSGVPHV